MSTGATRQKAWTQTYGVGEVLRRVSAKVVMEVVKEDVIQASNSVQILPWSTI